MKTVLATVVIPFTAPWAGDDEPAAVKKVNDTLDTLGDTKGRSFQSASRRLRACGVHFLSIVAVPPGPGENRAHLVIEVTADEPRNEVLRRVAGAIAKPLREILKATGVAIDDAIDDAIDGALGDFLERHELFVKLQLFTGTAGLLFPGTPGMALDRIGREFRLARQIRTLLDGQSREPDSALSRLYDVREKIFPDPKLKWAFVSEPMPLRGAYTSVSFLELAPIAFRDFGWFLLPLPLLALIVWPDPGFAYAVAVEAVLGIAIFGLGFWQLRRQEKNDLPFDREPEEPDMREILARENRPGYAQNHLAGVSTMKRGWFRYVTLRIGLWLIAESGPRGSPPGFIDRIGNIHSARWLRLPGTRHLLFLSNYGGNWQGYLEDFIARLRDGLSSVWSNTLNFPKTRLLTQGGAEDGARFKRWARNQQIPTRYWFSAYPELTTAAIRRNAEIRHGFASATNEEQAAKWLSLFGFATRHTLESREIPKLAFGGMKAMRHAHALRLRFTGRDGALKWLRALEPRLTYGEAMPEKSAVVAGFTATGLTELGVGRDSMATFPIAFQQGMSGAGRARALYDTPEKWRWPREDEPVHAILLVYGKTPGDLRGALDEELRHLKEGGVLHDPIDLAPLGDTVTEPFGFRDGISQPIMRGSKRWSRTATDSIHTVEPGELVLGYPDNFLNIAPTPQAHGVDVGRNSTYLVVREFEQHGDIYTKYIEERAAQYLGTPGVPGGTRQEVAHWLQAKMVGRWKDGSSLTRHPDQPSRLPPEEYLRARAASASPSTPEAETPGPPPAKDTVDPDNAFLFGREDPDGLRCPLGAHIRRANPRDSLEPGSEMQIKLSNRHRVMRVGRNLAGNSGLLFMCVNADIERQFEFLQQAWLHGPDFHGLDESDPLLGRGSQDGVAQTMTIPTPHGPLRIAGLKEFVTVKGGAYFFLPGRTAMSVLAWGRAGRPAHDGSGTRRGYA